MAAHPRIARRSARPGPAAFSLLETAIALGILGVGLIMVAAVFPVALTQHRRVAEQADATRLAPKPEALIKGRVDTTGLYPQIATGGFAGLTTEDSPFYLLPTTNLRAGSDFWDFMRVPSHDNRNYADVLNSPAAPIPPLFDNATHPSRSSWFVGLDILSDENAPYSNDNWASPFTDDEFNQVPGHGSWVGFYRRLSNGQVQFAVAICHARRYQRFAQQDPEYDPGFSAFPASVSPVFESGDVRRLPVPWRVQVVRDPTVPGRNILGGALGNELLAELAPQGAQIMIRGRDLGAPSLGAGPPVNVPAGRILTTIDDEPLPGVDAIEVREGLDGIPFGQPFDVWVLPPAVISGGASNAEFDTESPVLEWKLFL